MKVGILLQQQQQQQQWCVFMLLIFLLLAAAAVGAAAPPPPPPQQLAKRGCNDTCGDQNVRYPFGIGNSTCSKDETFHLNCTYADEYGNEDGGDDIGKKYRLWYDRFEIANISVENGTATTYTNMSYYCYDESGQPAEKSLNSFKFAEASPFTFSSTGNKFTALGCDTVALMRDCDGMCLVKGCATPLCDNSKINWTNVDVDGGCSSEGCCQTQVPRRTKSLDISIEMNFSYVRNFSQCSFAFLANQDWPSDFTGIDLMDTSNFTRLLPAVLDWVVGNDTCESFSHNTNTSSYACGANTNCTKSDNGPGYRCSCQDGYEGNPYLPQGCQDVDECKDRKRYKCKGKCENTVGNYKCHCRLGQYGDGKVKCKGLPLSTTAPAVAGACLFIVVTTYFLRMECTQMEKARNVRKNGGSLLGKRKIFKGEELKKATNNYDDTHLLGRGGSGSVYKGVLPDKSLVAIKKSNVNADTTRRRIRHFRSREEMNNEFQHEIDEICQVRHKNIVKLLGLCLETDDPLLVYEFISNGSLFDHIHNKCSQILNSWKNRLRIAKEIAEALEHLHSKVRIPIIHKDVKSKNILLDENLSVKVSDCGASVLIPLEQSVIINTKVHSTHEYLDPEYLITGNLTLKSDVYSFGVVLMELLTSQKPISRERSGENVNFIEHFISSVEQGKLGEVLSAGRFDDCEEETKQVQVVAELAVKCLSRSGVRRPDMTEVFEGLRRLTELHDQYSNSNNVETESLQGLGDHQPYDHSTDHKYIGSSSSFEITQSVTTAFDDSI